MPNHEENRTLAQEVLSILGAGQYMYGEQVVRLPSLDLMRDETLVFEPQDREWLLATLAEKRGRFDTVVTVVNEDTFTAAHRLQTQYGKVAVLNFANAVNPGGGFLWGASAQEEDLCRCSALYLSLTCRQAKTYYLANDEEDSPLYTHHLIYSPDVPVFRDRKAGFLPTLFPVSVITAPAPYLGEMLEFGDTDLLEQVPQVLTERAELILAVAAAQGVEHLVLGAWGCGAFQNDPVEVANIFNDLLRHAAAGVFQNVVFAVYDSQRDQPNFRTFRRILGTS